MMDCHEYRETAGKPAELAKAKKTPHFLSLYPLPNTEHFNPRVTEQN